MINGLSSSNNNLAINTLNSASDKSSIKIELVKKGEAGYMEAMDEDRDGVVTMEEFNNYCAQNGVSEEEKLTLLEAIQSAKMSKQINDKTQEAQKSEENNSEEEVSQDENKVVYARKGDDKYNEVMDENKNGVVTYEEYLKYCQEKTRNTKNEKSSKTDEIYSSSDETAEEEISVEAEA